MLLFVKTIELKISTPSTYNTFYNNLFSIDLSNKIKFLWNTFCIIYFIIKNLRGI